jgi:hypothetical protein
MAPRAPARRRVGTKTRTKLGVRIGQVVPNVSDQQERRLLLSIGGSVEVLVPRASWKGFWRLSLVACPIYLAAAQTKWI